MMFIYARYSDREEAEEMWKSTERGAGVRGSAGAEIESETRFHA